MVDRMPADVAMTDEAGADYKDMALDFAATAREQWTEKSRALTDLIINQPLAALGVALGMGVALGWLIKRR